MYFTCIACHISDVWELLNKSQEILQMLDQFSLALWVRSFSFLFLTNRQCITRMGWSLGHTHTHTDRYNVINQPGGLWAGLSGIDHVLSNHRQIREDYICVLVTCLRNPPSVHVRDREKKSVCVSMSVSLCLQSERHLYMCMSASLWMANDVKLHTANSSKHMSLSKQC